MVESLKNEEKPYLSVIIPVYNEKGNFESLANELMSALEGIGKSWEIIFVDDGSDDGTWEELNSVAGVLDGGRVKQVRLARNYGQTIALRAGINMAEGEVIVTMDGDLQNDPADIPKMVEEIEKGADVVSGWRRKRRDPWLSRRLPSRLGNWFVAWQTGVPLHDFGCGLKAYRREIIKSVRLYGEMHRLIPALTSWMGAKLVEVEVNHRARSAGRSKYHLGRVFAVILDIISLKFFSAYAIRPTHVIGLWGIVSIFFGVLSVGAMIYLKWGMGVNMTRNPFLVISVLLFIVGMQLIALGLLGEVNVRTYYEMQEKEPYRIREIRAE